MCGTPGEFLVDMEESAPRLFAVDVPEPIVLWIRQLAPGVREELARRLEELGAVVADQQGRDHGSGHLKAGPFTLEYSVDSPARTIRVAGVKPATDARPILVVDDDPDLRAIICELLEDAGYRVVAAENGAVALEQLEQMEPPGLIVLDLMMPVMDGWQFLQRLQQTPAWAELPVVVVSAGDRRPQLVQSFLPKPFDSTKLLEMVKRHCGEGAVGEVDFKQLFEGVPGLYLVLRPDLTIVAVSDAYLEATMTRRHQILGRHLFHVFPDNPDDPEADGVRNLRASLDRVLQNRAADVMPLQKYDIRRPVEEGGAFEERWWSPLNAPILGPNGQMLYIVHQVADVTEFVRLKERGASQVRLTEELTKRAKLMETEMSAQTRELEAAHKRSELEQQLIGIVSHDLRNPIQIVMTGVSTLLRANGLTTEQQKLLTRVLNATHRSSRLIRDLLDFTQARLGGRIPINRTEGDMFDHLEDVVGELRASYPARSLVYRCAGDGRGCWDLDRIAQVITNLVVNALTYGADDAPVEIFARDVGEEILVEVHNAGPAVPAELMGKLFKPLQRGNTAGRERSIGLGLFISQQIASAHMGEITVTTSAEAGTTFVLRLPRK